MAANKHTEQNPIETKWHEETVHLAFNYILCWTKQKCYIFLCTFYSKHTYKIAIVSVFEMLDNRLCATLTGIDVYADNIKLHMYMCARV